ncbi:MAG: ATP-binding protein, partial [Bryobacteraceae bacterium]
VDLVLSPGPNLGRVRLDPGQLLQVVVNLVINARDAMPSGGTLLVETCNAGDQVVLAVRDTGVGMTPGVRDRIFEPFFTTKERGMGTGLGLSTVYGIVEQAGGTIEVTSAPDLGTTFRIALPRVAGDLEAPPETETSDVRGSETILLVESDPPLRRLLAEALARYGYRILEAGSGEEALQLAARYPGAIELMVADPVLPGGAGKVLADRMESLRPYTKVLYISGPPGETVLGSASNYLQKPFTPTVLAHRIRHLLGQR